MTDIVPKHVRSRMMSNIRGMGNLSTELKLVNIFRVNGITGWKRHQKILGKPDFVFRKQKLAVFVDGCFWHGCPKCYQKPADNRKFWTTKLKSNKERDRLVTNRLKKAGWKVIRLRECALKREKNLLGKIVKLI